LVCFAIFFEMKQNINFLMFQKKTEQNEIGIEGMKILSDALASNKKLTKLGLGFFFWHFFTKNHKKIPTSAEQKQEAMNLEQKESNS